MVYKALVSAHIYLDDNGKDKDIEIFSIVHNDDLYTGVFDDIDHALLDQIEPIFDEHRDKKSYFFMAIVESEFVECGTYEYTEYTVEHCVREIKEFSDITFCVKE